MLAATTALLASAATAESVHVVYGAYGSPSSTNVKHGIMPFIAEAERLTEGSLTFELHPGGSLVGSSTALSGVRDSLVDAAQVSSIYFPSELPQLNVAIDLSPGISADTRAVAAAATELNLLGCPGCKAEIEEWNIQYLGGYGVSSFSLLCAKPVQTLEDLKGLRVRAAGSFSDLATALGMTPVNTTITEVYEGLQRGQLDCTMGSPGWMDSFSIRDVATNILMLETGTAFGGPMLDVSLDIWGQLDDDQKDALKRAAALGTASAAAGYEAADEEVLASAEEDGLTIFQPGEDILAVLEQFRADRSAKVVADAERRGIPDAKETVDTFMSLLEKWNAIVEETGDDTEALADAMYQEIYSKM
nr:C4-dicarboxylate TRAP transporter substrate-binding protein [Oceanicola sp. 502str15]